MINVCAHYNGTTILLGSFETEKKANEFMKNKYVLHYADEYEYPLEDEIIYPDEMFIEDEVPFMEPATDFMLNYDNLILDELPF